MGLSAYKELQRKGGREGVVMGIESGQRAGQEQNEVYWQGPRSTVARKEGRTRPA